MKTGLVTSNTYQNHNTGEGHPEKIDRVTAVIDNFKKINNKETQVILGPYTSVNLLKNDYIRLNNYGFEELDIYIND